MERRSYARGWSPALWVLLVIAIFGFGLPDTAFALDQGKLGVVCDRTLKYLEGGFGSLISAITGIGAIVASASGGFRTAWALVIVSIGAFILREYVDIFFSGLCSSS
jgi:hypothetical protein